MQIPFFKYHGTANDFIILDQRSHRYLESDDQDIIAHMCDRRFGIGADGLMFLESDDRHDFKMVYFNADGGLGSMCGNGGRCIVALAAHLNQIIRSERCTFEASDGMHQAIIDDDEGLVSLKMRDVYDVRQLDQDYELDTGSPHYVRFVDDLDSLDMVKEGRAIRYNEEYKEEGINVNFVKIAGETLYVRTYERGVEDETFSCGTGVVAASLAAAYHDFVSGQYKISTKGGELTVSFIRKGRAFKNIWLTGPATLVFEGHFGV